MKVEVYPANTHDSIPLVPLVDELRSENPGIEIGNLNADNGYQSPKNAENLASRGINNSLAQRLITYNALTYNLKLVNQ